VQSALSAVAGSGDLAAATYYYVVAPVSEAGEGLPSNERSVVVAGVKLATPTITSITPSLTGGHMADDTDFRYRVTAYNAAGETLPSAETVVHTGIGGNLNSCALVCSAVAGATGYRWYRQQGGLPEVVLDAGNSVTATATRQYFASDKGTPPDIGTTGAAITATWAEVAGRRFFRVYRGTVAGAENTLVAEVYGLSYIDKGAPVEGSFGPPTVDQTILTVGGAGSQARLRELEVVSDGANWRIV